MKKKSFKEKFYESHPGLYLIMIVIRRVIKKDDEYIKKIYTLDSSPDYIKLTHKGNENPGKIIFNIGDLDRSVGFCAVIMDTIKKLVYAEDHGLVPNIRYTDNFLYFDDEKNKEISNPFEYYFNKVQVDGAENSLNVVVADTFHANYAKSKYELDAYTREHFYNEMLELKCAPVIRKYLQIKQDIVEACEQFINGRKVLGVHYRGTDYKVGYDFHPVMATDNQYVQMIDERMSTGNYDAIFLATDDSNMCKLLKEKYGDKVFFYDDVYRSDGDVSVAFSEDDRPYHHYMLGFEIVRDMYSLSLCEGLIAGKSHVSFLANLYKLSRDEKYKTLDILDNGMNDSGKIFYDSVKELKNLK